MLAQSPYFANALKPEWASMREGPIDLKDADSEAFAPYVQWLYAHAKPKVVVGSMTWAKAYVLGERLMDPEYQYAILAALINECKEEDAFPTGGDEITIIYAGTPSDSPARKLLVDFFCYEGLPSWVADEDFARNGPADFVNDVLLELMRKKNIPSGPRPWEKSPASYMIGTLNANSSNSHDGASESGGKFGTPTTTLALGNLSVQCSTMDLWGLFGKYGGTWVSLPHEHADGVLQGVGFVEFANIKQATAALHALHGTSIKGLPLQMDYAFTSL